MILYSHVLNMKVQTLASLQVKTHRQFMALQKTKKVQGFMKHFYIFSIQRNLKLSGTCLFCQVRRKIKALISSGSFNPLWSGTTQIVLEPARKGQGLHPGVFSQSSSVAERDCSFFFFYLEKHRSFLASPENT